MGRQPLPTNTILGVGTDQYRIDTVLGPGGFGVTYLARDLRTGREVAVKEYFPAEFAYREGSTTVRPSTHGTSQSHFDQGKRHFLAEASTLAKFRHPHIVRVLNLFEQFGTAYMVLEFEEGQSLKSWLRTLGRRPSQADLDALLGPLLDALVQVHSKGMFHRDIAPDNIIVRPAGDPVLIDFGAARNFVREHSFTLGPVVKHGYSPPEQYTRDTRLQGAWSDIYSLSATIYAALMGKPPEEASRRQLNDTALPVSRHLEPARRALYRPSFIAAVDAGLQLRPKDRPQTAEDFRRLVLGEEAQSRRIASRLSGSGASRLSSDRPAAASLAPASRASEPADRPLPPPGVLPKGGAPDDAYPESAARTAGLAALAVATLAAVLFLMLGGIGHPAGMATVMLVCGSLVVAGLERLLAVTRSSPADLEAAGTAAAVMSGLAFAIFWLPLALWPLTVLLAGLAVVFAQVRPGRWMPVSLLALAVTHLLSAGLLLMVATRSVQKEPLLLPLMGGSLAVLASVVMASALHIHRRWEPAAT